MGDNFIFATTTEFPCLYDTYLLYKVGGVIVDCFRRSSKKLQVQPIQRTLNFREYRSVNIPLNVKGLRDREKEVLERDSPLSTEYSCEKMDLRWHLSSVNKNMNEMLIAK